VHGPNPDHGCGPAGVVACGVGRTSPLAFPAPGRSGSACSVRPKVEAARPGPLARWSTRRHGGCVVTVRAARAVARLAAARRWTGSGNVLG
jgi:hypothetical protein